MPAAAPTVLLVAIADAVAREFCAYLEAAGLPTALARSVPAPRELPPSVRALVVFPDARPLAIAAMVQLRRGHPDVLLLLVTSTPARYQAVVALAPRVTVVLPAPAFGWHVVDELRRHVGTGGA